MMFALQSKVRWVFEKPRFSHDQCCAVIMIIDVYVSTGSYGATTAPKMKNRILYDDLYNHRACA